MELGIPSLDFGHKKVVELINELIDEVGIKESSKRRSTVVVKLLDRIALHIEFEEKMLLTTKFPQFEKHRRSNLLFIQELVMFGNRIEKPDDEKAMTELCVYLAKGWIRHILSENMEFKDYLIENKHTYLNYLG